MENFKVSSQSYHDFAGLGELKARVKNDDKGAAREVGQKFEAMFIQMMLKSVRDANEPLKSDLMSSQAQDTFEEMYHQELAQEMSQRGVFGLAEWLTDTIQQQTGNIKAIDSYQQASSMPVNSAVEQRVMPIEQAKRSFATNVQDIK
ncbi:MAG: rod-binding protein [Porticoccaceae bacterium]|nr:rod-binding protein [Porticoccaceae bacterium]